MILDCLLSRLDPVDRSGPHPQFGGRARLYIYNRAGMVGYLALRKDRKGLISFALYRRSSFNHAVRLEFKRKKDRFPRAQRPVFLTAIDVWAHLNGHSKTYLEPQEYADWKQSLERAAGVDQFEQDDTVLRYVLPILPGPDEDWWRNHAELVLGRRLYARRRRLIHRIWQFLVDHWNSTATSPCRWAGKVTGWPRAIRAADIYLAKVLAVDRNAVARAIHDLDRLGFVQAVRYERPADPHKRGIYWYFPDSGRPPAKPTRDPDVTILGARRWMHEQDRVFGRGWHAKMRISITQE